MKFLFGDIVVVEDNLIGVVVKSWETMLSKNRFYEVYVRNYNGTREYDEQDIERYRVRHKELNEEEMYYQYM